MEIKQYFIFFKKNILIILGFTIIFTGLAFVYSKYRMVDIYEASSMLYVGRNSVQNEVLQYNDLLIGASLANDYIQVAKSRLVLESAIFELVQEGKISDSFGYEGIFKKININCNNRVMQIKIQDDDYNRAVMLVNKITQIFIYKTNEIINGENVKVIDTAVYSKDMDPIKKKYRLIYLGPFFGILLGIAFALAREYMKNDVNDEKDINTYLELPVIGMISHTNHRKLKKGALKNG